MRVPRAIRGLFSREDGAALPLEPPTPDRSGTHGRPARSDRARLRHFERRLRALTLAEDRSEPLVAGRLQIIALSRIKVRLGEDWPRLANRVHRLTRQILDRRLTEADVYVRAADRYVILFATLTAVEAGFKAQAIARELSALLIGELSGVDEAPVHITVHEIDPGALRARPTLDTLVARMEADTCASGTHAGEPTSRASAAGQGPVRFDYLPIWSRRGRAIVGYVCTRRPGAAGDEGDPYELDCLALRSVLASLPDMERHGHAALVVAPLHWETLVQLPRRQSYLELCRHVPPQLSRQLGFAVVDVATAAWHDLIRDRLLPLKPFARLFFVCVPPDPTQIRHFADLGVDALAFEAAAPAGGSDDAQPERNRNFARHGLAICALEVDDRDTALALVNAGVDFLGGPAIAPPLGAPGAAYRLDLTAGGRPAADPGE